MAEFISLRAQIVSVFVVRRLNDRYTLTQAKAVNQRRHPFAECDRRRARKNFFVSPHRARACAKSVESQRPFCNGKVVPGEQRRAASGT